jgi:cell division protein FtsA
MEKQLLAAVEIADHEIRLVVAEIYNTRLQIIKTERVECSGYNGKEITNEKDIVNSLKRAVENASKNIGASIQQVLLLIPSVDSKRVMRRVTGEVSNLATGISQNDIQRTFAGLLHMEYEPELEVINVMVTKYIVNGISMKKPPIHESAEHFVMETEVYLANRELAYGLATCVEKAGLGIIDIVLDAFGLAKEASLLEQSTEEVIIAIRLERATTHLCLFSAGKLLSSEILDIGYGEWISQVKETFDIPLDVASRLMIYNCRCDGPQPTEAPIYMWSQNGQTHTCSLAQLMDALWPRIKQWIVEVNKTCEPIIATKRASVVLTGEGAIIQGLDHALQLALQTRVSLYIPETLGVRNGAFTALLGAFYMYKDLEVWRRKTAGSINLFEFNAMISARKSKDGSGEETFPKRLKGIFETKK